MIQLNKNISQMAKELRNVVINSKREMETNLEWGSFIKGEISEIIQKNLIDFSKENGQNVRLVKMPYTAETGSGRGSGHNLIRVEDLLGEDDKNNVYCLIDELDGTWNMNCGLGFSTSTTLAFTKAISRKPEDLRLIDFHAGFIIPYFGNGIYWNELFHIPHLETWDGEMYDLHMSPIVTPKQTRVMIDLFTEERLDSLALSLDPIKSVIYNWCDFGRLYGAGVEITSLFGWKNIQPGFSAWVAANQKMDNIVPFYSLIIGAGGIVTDWWGNSIVDKKLTDRVHIVMSANQTLHDNLISHLSSRPKPE